MNCVFCQTGVPGSRIEFRAECPKCGGDLHICLNCRFYDEYAAGQCREPAVPDPVKDKDRRNLCEYFKPAGDGPDVPAESDSDAARRQLEDLFRK